MVSRGPYGSFLEKGSSLLQWLLLCKCFISRQIILIPERNLGFWGNSPPTPPQRQHTMTQTPISHLRQNVSLGEVECLVKVKKKTLQKPCTINFARFRIQKDRDQSK